MERARRRFALLCCIAVSLVLCCFAIRRHASPNLASQFVADNAALKQLVLEGILEEMPTRLTQVERERKKRSIEQAIKKYGDSRLSKEAKECGIRTLREMFESGIDQKPTTCSFVLMYSQSDGTVLRTERQGQPVRKEVFTRELADLGFEADMGKQQAVVERTNHQLSNFFSHMPFHLNLGYTRQRFKTISTDGDDSHCTVTLSKVIADGSLYPNADPMTYVFDRSCSMIFPVEVACYRDGVISNRDVLQFDADGLPKKITVTSYRGSGTEFHRGVFLVEKADSRSPVAIAELAKWPVGIIIKDTRFGADVPISYNHRADRTEAKLFLRAKVTKAVAMVLGPRRWFVWSGFVLVLGATYVWRRFRR